MDADHELEPELPQLPSLPPPSVPGARLGTTPTQTPKPPRLQKVHSQDANANFAGTSSDPPVFSSDDVPAGSENYATARRKKASRVGPWWESSHPRKRRRMEPLNRNFDSGVFMDGDDEVATDATEPPSSELDITYHAGHIAGAKTAMIMPLQEQGDSKAEGYTRWDRPQDLTSSFYSHDEVPGPSESPVSESAVQDRHSTPVEKAPTADPAPKGFHNSRKFRLRLSPPNPESASRHPALEVVENAVENGIEDIDLSGQFVWHDPAMRAQEPSQQRLDDRIFHPLHHLVKTRAVHDPDRYDSLVPDMRLWLSSNRLERLPTEIYRLRNLTKLGLRGNKLRTLDPAVGRLERLLSLNLTGNRLNYLPWEITKLRNLTDLMVDDGHLYKPLVDQKLVEKARKASEASRRTLGSLIAVSPISWLDMQGLPVPHSAPRPSTSPAFDPSTSKSRALAAGPAAGNWGRALSMADICLRTAARSPDLQALLASTQVRYLPPHLVTLLRSALNAKQTDGLDCSVCARRFIIPRAEWLEWVDREHSDSPLPLLRTACSWSCADEYICRAPLVVSAKARAQPGSLAAWGCGWTMG